MQSLLLPYRFPRAPSEEPENCNLGRDAQIGRDLEIERSPAKVGPVLVHEPYVKTFCRSSSPESMVVSFDPLDDILQESKLQIDAYVVDMPYTKIFETKQAPATPRKPRSAEQASSVGKKRTWNVLDNVDQNQLENVGNVSIGGIKTPTLNSVFHLKPSSASKKAKATPDLKSLRNKQSFSLKNSVLKSETARNEEADLSYDPLACHAENIMRMAMDSTMLGSFNNSFNSTFSNLGEDSILGKRAGELHGDDPEKSLIETMKKRWPGMLDKQRATKIEISADDLQNAVNEPIFIK